ncbi:hypothetical protein FRC09_007258, partial [Ceratobasidium sp. 395]
MPVDQGCVGAARQQQTSPSPFLKLPADILAQIIPNLSPIDVVYLARVNTLVREVLMHRSASSMWRACIENAGLPTCPPELSEPKYVSVLCLLICSGCGTQEDRKPDTYLLVRLCGRCRRKKLIDWKTVKPEELRTLALSSGASRISSDHISLRHSFKEEAQKTKADLHALRSSDNERAVQAWLESRKDMIQTREERGDLISQWVEKTYQDRLQASRNAWRQRAELRLIALGYSLPDQDFPSEKKLLYESFFNRTDDFTERKWDSLELRIIEFLEDEAKERPERQRSERRYKRELQLHKLLSQMLEELDVSMPENLGEISVMGQTTLLASWLPLPKVGAVRKWSIFDGWIDLEIPAEGITERFNTQQEEITGLVLNWGKRIKRELAVIIREGRQTHGLTSNQSQENLPTTGREKPVSGNMDEDTSLLLRADSFFEYQDDSSIWSYAGIVLTSCMRDNLDPTSFAFHSEPSLIAQALLASLGCPNASGLEFTNEYFRCGRCYSNKMRFSVAIRHYMDKSKLWQSIEPSLPNFSILGITCNNAHDFSSHTSRPLLIRLSPQEVTDMTAKFDRLNKMLSWDKQAAEELGVSIAANNAGIFPFGSEGATGDQGGDEGQLENNEPELWRDRFGCKLCEQAQLDSDMHTFRLIPHVFAHLRDVHDIPDPERELDVADRKSIKNSPYFRLTQEFDELAWGWAMSTEQ